MSARSTAASAPRTPSPRRLLITGGGSGGHVFPGLAVASALATRGVEVAWAGGAGMEGDLVRQRGLLFHSLAAAPLVGRGWLGKVRALLRLAGSALAGRSLVRRGNFAAVLGTGGYVSAPAALGAWLARRPLVLLEPNAEAGVANKLLSRFAREALVAHDATGRGLHCPSRTTGVPVRDAFFTEATTPADASTTDGAPAELPPSSALRVLVLGGSQGARDLNRLVPEAFAQLPSTLGPLEVLHQAGRDRETETEDAWRRASGPADDRTTVSVVGFLDDVAAAMRACHLVISRAGAITLAEICAAGRPSLLLPLGLANGHQQQNARALEDQGAARVAHFAPGADDTTRASQLADILSELLGDRASLDAAARAARALAAPGAAERIADRLMHHAFGDTTSPETR